MKESKKLEEVKGRSVYEKPLFVKEKSMTFPLDIIDSLGHRIMCKQCSSCHGCQ